MSDDFLARVKQLQYTNPNLAGDSAFGATNFGSFGVNAQDVDIWTQAEQLENRYKSQLQVAATMSNPSETSNVMNNFMNEALDMLFNSLKTQKASSISPSITYTPEDFLKQSEKTVSNNDPQPKEVSSKEESQQKEKVEKPLQKSTDNVNTDNQPSENKKSEAVTGFAKTIKKETTPSAKKDVAEEKAVVKAEEKVQRENKDTENIKKYKAAIDEKIDSSIETAVATKKVMTEVVKDKELTPEEKFEINSYYHEKVKEQGIEDKSKWIEKSLVKELYKKITKNPSYTAAEAIETLKDVEKNLGKDKKGNQIHLSSLFSDSASFAVELYLKAQKEGNLKEALEVMPPTESIQKKLIFQKETSTIYSLIKDLDTHVVKTDNSKNKNLGVSTDRQKELDNDFEEYTKNYNAKKTSIEAALEREIFPSLLDGGKYSDSERLYILEKIYEDIGKLSIKSKKDPYKEFVNSFRSMSWDAQEKYFEKILETYGGYSSKK